MMPSSIATSASGFNALNVITAFGLTAADEILTAVPMFHSGGLFIHTTPGLCAGATVTIHRQFDPGLLLEDVQRYRVTLLACVPAMTLALAAHPAWDQADLSSLRTVLTGSTFVPRGAVEPWQHRGVPVMQGYGSTEACPVVTALPAGSPAQRTSHQRAALSPGRYGRRVYVRNETPIQGTAGTRFRYLRHAGRGNNSYPWTTFTSGAYQGRC